MPEGCKPVAPTRVVRVIAIAQVWRRRGDGAYARVVRVWRKDRRTWLEMLDGSQQLEKPTFTELARGWWLVG